MDVTDPKGQREPEGRPTDRPSMPAPGAIDQGLRARAAKYYTTARDLYEQGHWGARVHAQRIACLMWHLADPSLDWDGLVHC